MKVDTNRLKKGTSELTPECRQLIEEMNARKTRRELLEYLENLRGWVYGKCELFHWIDLLDRFDDILAEAAKEHPQNEFALFCDTSYSSADIRLLLYVINFTTLLIEHSFSRHLYNSIEHLTQLLSSTNMDIVMCVLNLLYMFSKRSNFIPRLNSVKKISLLSKLFNFAESWGGKENGFSLAQCCKKEARLPVSSSTLYFEYYNSMGQLDYIEVPALDKMEESAATIAKVVCDKIPHLGSDQRIHILTRIRLAATFRDYRMRLQFVQARLQAISVLVYSNALQDNIHTLLYPGFLEELVELLEMKDVHLVEIRAAALRTLTSIIHLDRNPHFPKKPGSRLSKIIQVTGAGLYHGFLPTLVRTCINHLISMQTRDIDLSSSSVIHQFTLAYKKRNSAAKKYWLEQTNQFPLSLATALFSFLYHLASYEAGGEALVACGMMESLLRVINWPGVDLEHITFVTRAVRVIDLITNIDMHSFHGNNGLGAFIQRLEIEVYHCRQVQQASRDKQRNTLKRTSYLETGDTLGKRQVENEEEPDVIDMEGTGTDFGNEDNSNALESEKRNEDKLSNEPSGSNVIKKFKNSSEKKATCLTQRAALLKSMLNFLKKSIQDNAYNNGMRNVMETSLPNSLRNIISNAEYYGPSLFLLATDVVTVYVFQEPSLLCTLQDSGLTNIVLQSLLRKEVPATREVLGSLPNVFSALCLNARGLREFASYQPFDRLFQVLLSPEYLVAMRRRRSSDPLGDTATNLGNAIDDLIKHHPSLRTEATKSIIKLLNELVRIGSDPYFICWRANNSSSKSEPILLSQASSSARSQNKDTGNGSSGEEEEDEEISSSSQQKTGKNANRLGMATITPEEREPVPLIDYILNVMKFLDAVVSNGTNGDHCREFVKLGGLQPLLSILSLPNLPVDSPVTTTAQAVAQVCKSVLNLAHETKIIDVAIAQLSQIVEQLSPLVVHMNSPGKSVLLKELTSCPKTEAGFSNASYTPLLHSMSAVHGYVVMLVHICRNSQNDIRPLLLRKWGMDCIKGKKLLQSLVQLYTSLVWESTILLGMCSEENASKASEFNYDDVSRLQTGLRREVVDIEEEPSQNILPRASTSTAALSARLHAVLSSTTPASRASASRGPLSTAYAATLGPLPIPAQPFVRRITPITVLTALPDDPRSAAEIHAQINAARAASTSLVTQAATQSAPETTNMEIDDDVICLTPLPPRPISSDVNISGPSQSAIEANDETISIDSTSSSSSDSVVFIPNVPLENNESGSNNEKETKKTEPTICEDTEEDAKRQDKAISGQLRYIKALLAASSRLGRALAELFGNLVKLCVGSPGRQRRANELLSYANFPFNEAREIAKALSYILVNGFCYDKIVSPNVPKLKLTFLICSVGFTGPMLFDEKRYAFHLMLSQFCEEGGLEAFFDMFRWALTYGCPENNKEEFIKGKEYAEGTGEFLDAWLLLLEKMTNPRAIFESPHCIPSRQTPGLANPLLDFEPIFYMVKVHTLALKALLDILDKKPLQSYGTRMAESVMAIMKHIIKNESMLREKFEKRKEELAKFDEEEKARQHYREVVQTSVNMNHLRLFMDMGFAEVHVSEALDNTSSLEQATDFLLNRPDTSRPVDSSPSGEPEEEDDDDEDDDEMSTSRDNNIDSDETYSGRIPIPASPPVQNQNSNNKKTWRSVQFLPPSFFDDFCRKALNKSFNTMDQLPETVNSGADLFAVLYRRHSPEMKQKILLYLTQNITDYADKVANLYHESLTAAELEEILVGKFATKLYVRLKVGCLILEETNKDMRKQFCISIKNETTLSTLILLLQKIEIILRTQSNEGDSPVTPKWLQHLIEFMDSVDNSLQVMQRRKNMHLVTTKNWKWYDSSAGKWNSYSGSNNEIINNAFLSGERSIRITCGRQKYTINFNCMSQVNEATGNHRPVIPGLKATDASAINSKGKTSTDRSYASPDSDSDCENLYDAADRNRSATRSDRPQDLVSNQHHSSSENDGGDSEKSFVGLIGDESNLEPNIDEKVEQSLKQIILHEEPIGLHLFDTNSIVACLVRLLNPKLALELDTVNSILKLCVRLTKDYEVAKTFVLNGGIRIILNMRQMCGYMGFPTHAILLIRHVLEEPHTLLATMERVIASRTLSTISSGHRDLIFVLRQMSSAVARDPKLFMQAALNILHLDYNVLKNKVESLDDSRLVVKSSNNFKKLGPENSTDEDITFACGSSTLQNKNSDGTAVINELLKALILPCIHFQQPLASTPSCQEKTPLTFGGLPATKTAYLAADTAAGKSQTDDSQSDQCCCWHIPSSNHYHDKPLLTRSTILKILADAVRSYQSFVPKLIIDHCYEKNESKLITRDQSALSFILDNFLPLKEHSQDREVSTMARVLLTSLSECVDQHFVQKTVVVEVKAAIQRAIKLPEGSDKHIRLQMFVGLLPTMIDNPAPLNKITTQRNEIFVILLRKGIMADLANMILHLDLSNPNSLATLNAILKPMETLLRLTIAPGVLSKKKTTQLQSVRRAREVPLTAQVMSSGRTLARHITDTLGEALRNVPEHARSSSFIFQRDLTSGNPQLSNIFDDILGSTHQLFNTRGRNFENLHDNEVPTVDVAFETSSESSDSESNASDDNEDRGVDDDDANEEQGEERSEADADEETRQFIEVFDHVYASDQPRSASSNRHLSGAPILRYTVSSSANSSGPLSSRIGSSSSVHSQINENRISNLPHQVHQRISNASVLSRSFNPIQQQNANVNIGIIRSSPATATNSNTEHGNIDDDLIARFNYYINHGQSFNSRSSTATIDPANTNFDNISNGTNTSNSTTANTATATGDSTDPRAASSNRLQRDSRRLLFVDQQYCTSLTSNNVDESQNELFNQDALHWWLEEAKHLDMESLPDICLTVAHQIAPGLREMKDKTNKRKRKTTLSFHSHSISPGSSLHTSMQETTENASSSNSLGSISASEPSSSNSRRTAIQSVDPRSTTVIGVGQPVESNDRENQIDQDETLITNEENLNTTEENENADTDETDSNESDSVAVSQHESLFDSRISYDVEAESRLQSQQNVGESDFSTDTRQRLDTDLTEAAMVPLPDDDDDEDDDDDVDEDEMDEDEEGEEEEAYNDERQDNENEENDDENDRDEEDYEDLNVEEVIMDFDDEIQNVLSQFSDTHNPQLPFRQQSANTPHLRIVSRLSEVLTSEANSSNQTNATALNRNSISPAPNVSTNSRASTSADTALQTNADTLSTPGTSGIPRSSQPTNLTRNFELSPEIREILGELQIPEGVDPSFLAALPSEMREEVVQEHLRAQRNRQRAQQNAIETQHESLIEVNPDFLAALPPSIQAEVLSQQRIEQQRQAAQTANPNDPVDAAEFFQNLQPSLRQSILTDMEESQIASLPPELIAEAQNLRRDWERRNRQVVQERLANQLNATRPYGGNVYIPPRAPANQQANDRPNWQTNSIWYNSTPRASTSNTLREDNTQQQHSMKPVPLAMMENEGSVLDVNALTSLMLMLFIEDAKFNMIRLHRVFRHLCYHTGTREWIIDSLISIIEVADETDETEINSMNADLIYRPKYLTLKSDFGLGYRSSVFLLKSNYENILKDNLFSGIINNAIRIHPQAAPMVCRNALDLLITLARHFPQDFVPFKRNEDEIPNQRGNETKRSSKEKNYGIVFNKINTNINCSELPFINKAKKAKISHSYSDKFCEHIAKEFYKILPVNVSSQKRNVSIFEILLKLDHTTEPYNTLLNFKEDMEVFLSPQPVRSKLEFLAFEDSPFAQILSILQCAVIKRSPQLTDKVIRLLASLGMQLPKEVFDPINAALDEYSPDEEIVPAGYKKPLRPGQVISVHDSDSEDDTSSESDEDARHCIKRRKLSKKTSLKPSLFPSEIQQLKIAIEVLTTKSCSEEGLTSATELIVHLSQCSTKANGIIVQLLIRGVLGLADLVCVQIKNLLKDVKKHNLQASKQSEPSGSKAHTIPGRSGIINDRFTAAQVVISAPTKVKPTCELQLPSMAPLLIKSSSQAFFLRTLKVFMQVRDLIEFKALLLRTEVEPLSKVIALDELWSTLSECLVELEKTNDQHAVLILQPAVEAFFLIHASKSQKPRLSFGPAAEAIFSTQQSRLSTEEESLDQESNDSTTLKKPASTSTTPDSDKLDATPSTSAAATAAAKEAEIEKADKKKFLDFAEKHRTVLNQILRQSTVHLADGPFSVLVNHTRILDFDVKRKYFRTELERMDEGVRREELTVNVRRATVFEDSFRELYRRGPEEWKNRFYIVFEDEEGQDAGGLLREWYVIISREIFNPMYALFCVSPGDRVTYMINPSSHANPNHLCYFKFVGRLIAKAIHDNKLLECYFTRSFYKHILGKQVKYDDMESQDLEFYKGLAYLMKNDVSSLDLTFSTEVREFGVTRIRDLKPNGRNIAVTEHNKFDYIRLVCQLKMSGFIRQQLTAFLEGFYEIIPKRLISIFNEQELELLISGLPNIDIEDLKQNTEYHKYNSKSPQIQWLWRALRSFDQADRAKFLQFVTGTSKVPLQGFSALEGMTGIQKFQIHRDDRSTDRLPCAHTCFNQLDLPLYKSYEKLRSSLIKAIHECSEGFGFA